MKPRRRLSIAAAMVAGLAACERAPEERGLASMEALTVRCAFCHGPEGISGNPIWPSLAGADAAYTKRQLDRFARGEGGGRNSRFASQMYAISASFDEAERRRIALYYAGLAPPTWRPAPDHVAARLYSEGEGDIPACATCHGANGEGNAALGAPRLAGQSARYAAEQLHAFATGARDDGGSGMAAAARALSEPQIRSVAEYLQGNSTRSSR